MSQKISRIKYIKRYIQKYYAVLSLMQYLKVFFLKLNLINSGSLNLFGYVIFGRKVSVSVF
ncbi:hypothetical protein CGH51_24585, partial [Vibrio parahaemolyticus]